MPASLTRLLLEMIDELPPTLREVVRLRGPGRSARPKRSPAGCTSPWGTWRRDCIEPATYCVRASCDASPAC